MLLAGQLPLRYCTDRFAFRKPCCGLPERGHVHSLLTPVWEGASIVEVDDTGFSGVVTGPEELEGFGRE